MQAVCFGGARPAEAGEFTLRAFLAGRIDLTQAEAVLGVIDAAGSAELDAALKQLAGGLAVPLRRLRDDLLELLAHLEAGLDFADEDLPFITAEELLRQLDEAAAAVDRLVEQLVFRGEAAVRVRVALVGRPNAGKSSLFNALSGRSGAIVSDSARHNPRLSHRRPGPRRREMPVDRHGRHRGRFAGNAGLEDKSQKL